MHPTGNVAGNADSETGRINLLLERDGMEATRLWVERTLAIYRQALTSPHSHASKKEYRLLFERSVEDFERWLQFFEEARQT